MGEQEIFKPIEGFEDYEVSNYGNVKSLKNDIILKPSITNRYYRVSLCKDGVIYNKLVHRLVAEAFIPNPDNLSCVNHKDENKLNNNVENLEWCDYKYNSNYGTRNERISKTQSKAVVAVKNGEVVMEFPSTAEAGRNGFNFGSIGACCRGERNKHKGYQWFYKEDWLKMQATQSNERVACGKLNILI